jgi:hypothetical protein
MAWQSVTIVYLLFLIIFLCTSPWYFCTCLLALLSSNHTSDLLRCFRMWSMTLITSSSIACLAHQEWVSPSLKRSYLILPPSFIHSFTHCLRSFYLWCCRKNFNSQFIRRSAFLQRVCRHLRCYFQHCYCKCLLSCLSCANHPTPISLSAVLWCTGSCVIMFCCASECVF